MREMDDSERSGHGNDSTGRQISMRTTFVLRHDLCSGGLYELRVFFVTWAHLATFSSFNPCVAAVRIPVTIR